MKNDNVLQPPNSIASDAARTTRETLLQPDDLFKIKHGQVVVIPQWLSLDLVRRLQADAKQLFHQKSFSPDGLTNPTLTSQGFTSAKDRQTFRRKPSSNTNPWTDPNLGDVSSRLEFTRQMARLRNELAVGLNRPSLVTSSNSNNDDEDRHEMTYNWYNPGASLGRHLDEHHEETKGPKGWLLPTRRSVTWLVYLNDSNRKQSNAQEESEEVFWTAKQNGGALRCFPRARPSAAPVGCHDGNLQIGWYNHIHPVFLDTLLSSGQTALYFTIAGDDKRRQYISIHDFNVPRQPIDFSQFVKPRYRIKFEQISTPWRDSKFVTGSFEDDGVMMEEDQHFIDVVPTAGTLVLFDSVTLPHCVQTVMGTRPRIAATGWFHEDSAVIWTG